MAQKRSDLDTIPMCRVHHTAQHSYGWPFMIRKYGIDISEALEVLKERPYFKIVNFNGERRYVAHYRGREFVCCWAGSPTALRDSIVCATTFCREHLIDTYFRPLAEKRRAG